MISRSSCLAVCLALFGLLPACAATPATTVPATAAARSSPAPAAVPASSPVSSAPPLRFAFPLEACPPVTGGPAVLALFDKACDGGDAEGCHQAFVHYACGATRDMRKAADRAARACDRGAVSACGNAGISFLGLDDATAAEINRGIRALKKGCDANEIPACNNLAGAMMQGAGMARDEAGAAAIFARLCGVNNAPSCGNLGYMRMAGIGGPKDLAGGMLLARKGCDGGDPNSCNMVGFGYLGGGAEDAGAAVLASTFFVRACDAGLAAGCDNLGQLYASGKGVEQDLRRAEALFRKACGGGNAAACTHLGIVLSAKETPDPAPPSWHYEPASTASTY